MNTVILLVLVVEGVIIVAELVVLIFMIKHIKKLGGYTRQLDEHLDQLRGYVRQLDEHLDQLRGYVRQLDEHLKERSSK